MLKNVVGVDVEYVWHEEERLYDFSALILPGGFSYGDYLRAGGIARFSPLMRGVSELLERGGLVLGICNGFQILLEAGFLPGAMLKNSSLQFICDWTFLRVENPDTPFTRLYQKLQVVKIPIAHYEGNYFAEPAVLQKIEANGQVLFRYCSKEGKLDEAYNPNGSQNFIAGLMDETGRVLGLMPHPERASEKVLGSEDGLNIFLSMKDFFQTEGRRKDEISPSCG